MSQKRKKVEILVEEQNTKNRDDEKRKREENDLKERKKRDKEDKELKENLDIINDCLEKNIKIPISSKIKTVWNIIEKGSPKRNLIGHYPSSEKVFELYFPQDFWSICETELNNTCNYCSKVGSNAKRYNSPLSIKEIMNLLAIHFTIETETNNLKFDKKTVFKKISNNKILLSWRKFQFLHANMYFENISPLTDKMNEIALKYISPPSILAFDECVYPHAIKSSTRKHLEKWGIECPYFHIPRKPHKDGFLMYLVNCLLEESTIPYTCFFAPCWTQDETDLDLIKKGLSFLEDKGDLKRIVYVMDAAFDSIDILDFFLKNTEKYKVCMSAGISKHGRIPGLLDKYLKWNNCISIHGENSIIYSSKLERDNNGKKIIHFALSTFHTHEDVK